MPTDTIHYEKSSIRECNKNGKNLLYKYSGADWLKNDRRFYGVQQLPRRYCEMGRVTHAHELFIAMKMCELTHFRRNDLDSPYRAAHPKYCIKATTKKKKIERKMRKEEENKKQTQFESGHKCLEMQRFFVWPLSAVYIRNLADS